MHLMDKVRCSDLAEKELNKNNNQETKLGSQWTQGDVQNRQEKRMKNKTNQETKLDTGSHRKVSTVGREGN